MTIILKKGEELDVRAGAPWIYDNEIAEVREDGYVVVYNSEEHAHGT